MKLVVHVNVIPGESFYGLPTYDEVRILYDSGSYGRVIRRNECHYPTLDPGSP
jgi:hypothetical protein